LRGDVGCISISAERQLHVDGGTATLVCNETFSGSTTVGAAVMAGSEGEVFSELVFSGAISVGFVKLEVEATSGMA
jgi:hypothetical protein